MPIYFVCALHWLGGQENCIFLFWSSVTKVANYFVCLYCIGVVFSFAKEHVKGNIHTYIYITYISHIYHIYISHAYHPPSVLRGRNATFFFIIVFIIFF